VSEMASKCHLEVCRFVSYPKLIDFIVHVMTKGTILLGAFHCLGFGLRELCAQEAELLVKQRLCWSIHYERNVGIFVSASILGVSGTGYCLHHFKHFIIFMRQCDFGKSV